MAVNPPNGPRRSDPDPPQRGNFFRDIFNTGSQFTEEELQTFAPSRVFDLRNRVDLFQADPSQFSREEKESLLAELQAERESFNSIADRFSPPDRREDTGLDDFGDAFLNSLTRISGDVQAAFGNFDNQRAAQIRATLPDRTTDENPNAALIGTAAGEILPTGLAIGAAVVPGGQIPAAALGTSFFATRAAGAERGRFRQTRGIEDDAPLSLEEGFAAGGMAAIEGGAELLQLGFLTRLGSRAATSLGRAAIEGGIGRGASEAIGRAGQQLIQAPISEAIEEGATSIAQGAFREFGLGEQGGLVEGFQESLPAAGQGGIGGALLVPVITAVGGVSNRRVSRQVSGQFGGDFVVADPDKVNQFTAPIRDDADIRLNRGDEIGVSLSLAEGLTGQSANNETVFHVDVMDGQGNLVRTGQINAGALRDNSYLDVFGITRGGVNQGTTTAPAASPQESATSTDSFRPPANYEPTFQQYFGSEADTELEEIVRGIRGRFDTQFGPGAGRDLREIVNNLSRAEQGDVEAAVADYVATNPEVDPDAVSTVLEGMRKLNRLTKELEPFSVPIVNREDFDASGYEQVQSFPSLAEARAYLNYYSFMPFDFVVERLKSPEGETIAYTVFAQPQSGLASLAEEDSAAEAESGRVGLDIIEAMRTPGMNVNVDFDNRTVQIDLFEGDADTQVNPASPASSEAETFINQNVQDRVNRIEQQQQPDVPFVEIPIIDPNQTDLQTLMAQNYGRAVEGTVTREEANREVSENPDIDYALVPVADDEFILLGRNQEAILPEVEQAVAEGTQLGLFEQPQETQDAEEATVVPQENAETTVTSPETPSPQGTQETQGQEEVTETLDQTIDRIQKEGRDLIDDDPNDPDLDDPVQAQRFAREELGSRSARSINAAIERHFPSGFFNQTYNIEPDNDQLQDGKDAVFRTVDVNEIGPNGLQQLAQEGFVRFRPGFYRTAQQARFDAVVPGLEYVYVNRSGVFQGGGGGFMVVRPTEKGNQLSRRVTLRVNGENKTVTLEGAKLRAFDEEVRNYLETVDFIERSLRTPDQKARDKKAAAMRHAAEKRRITGLLTEREQKAADKRKKSMYVGKPVEVNGEPGEVVGNVFGKVKVRLNNGEIVTVQRDEVTPLPDDDGFRASLGDTDVALDEFDADEVLPITPQELRSARANRSLRSEESQREYTFPVDENGNPDFTGAPDNIKSPRDHFNLVRRLIRLAIRGVNGRFWYEDSSQRVLDLVGGNREDAEKFVQLIAIYSPRNPVPENWVDAVQAWSQYKAAQRRGTRPNLRAGMTREMDRTAAAVLFDNQPWDGRKTNSFYINMMRVIDPSIGSSLVVTVDRWMMRAFGYNTDNPSPRQYEYGERVTQEAAATMGWEPQQVQAAIWVAERHIANQFTSIRRKAKKRALENLQENGIITEQMLQTEEILTGSRPRTPEAIFKRFSVDTNLIDPAIIEKEVSKAVVEIARENRVTLDPNEVESVSFDDVADANMAQLSIEATPSSFDNLMPGIADATYEERLEYTNAVWNALHDANGRNEVFELFGLLADSDPLNAGGFWRGDFNPSIQFQAQVVKRQGHSEGSRPRLANFDIEPSNRQAVEGVLSVLGLLLKQRSVAYHRPVYVASAREANAVEFRMGRPVSREEVSLIYESMQVELGLFDTDRADDIVLIPSPDGVRVVNNGVFENNTDFHKFIQTAVGNVIGDQVQEGVLFATDGKVIKNNWNRYKNGQSYTSRAGLRGRPDLLRRVFGELSRRVATVNRAFAQEKGWGDPRVFEAHEAAASQIEAGAPISPEVLSQLFITDPSQLGDQVEGQVGEHRLKTIATEPGSTQTTEARLISALEKGDRNIVRSVLGTSNIVRVVNDNTFIVSAVEGTEQQINRVVEDLGLTLVSRQPRDGYTAITVQTNKEFTDRAAGIGSDFTASPIDSNVPLVYYGNTRGLSELTPENDGSNQKTPVIYAYRGGTKNEKTVTQPAQTKYVGKAQGDLYDIAQDSRGIVESAVEDNGGVYDEDVVVEAIKEAGFTGFYNSRSGLPNVVGVFNPVEVTEHPITQVDLDGEALVPVQRKPVVRDGDLLSINIDTAWSFQNGSFVNEKFPGYSVRQVDNEYQAVSPEGDVLISTEVEQTAQAAVENNFFEKRFQVKDDGRTPHMTQMVNGVLNAMFSQSANRDNVQVLDDFSQLPEDAKKFVRNKGFRDDQVHALTGKDGSIYFIAENMPKSVRDIGRVILHELVGHYGVREVLGDQFNQTLDSIYQNIDRLVSDGTLTQADVDMLVKRYKLDLENARDQRILAEEIIAHVAETDSNPTFLEQIYNFIRQKFRDLFGITVEMDGAILRKLLADSRRFVGNPTPRYGSVNDNSYGHEKDNGIELASAEEDLQSILGERGYKSESRRIMNLVKQGIPFDDIVSPLPSPQAREAAKRFAKAYARDLNFARAPLPPDAGADQYVDYVASISQPAARAARAARVQGMMERVGNNVGALNAMMLRTTNQELGRLARKYPDSRARELKDELFVDPTSRNVTVGYQQNVQLEMAKIMQDSGRILQGIYGEPGIGQVLRRGKVKQDTARLTEIIRGAAPVAGEARLATAAGQIRKMLDDFRDYLVAAGAIEPGQYVDDYFPRIYDNIALRKPELKTKFEDKMADIFLNKGINQYVADNGVPPTGTDLTALQTQSREKAINLWEMIVLQDNAVVELLDTGTTIKSGARSLTHSNARTLADVPDSELQEFLVQDPAEVLTRYFRAGVRHAEYVRRFGKKSERAIEMIQDIREHMILDGADSQNIDFTINRIENILNAYQGVHDFEQMHRTPEFVRNSITGFRLLMGMKLLGFASINALIEFGAPGVRAGVRSATKGFVQGTGTFIANAIGIKTERQRFLESLGMIGEQGALGIINNRFFNFNTDESSNLAQTTARWYYKINLLEPITRLQRTIAGAAAQDVVSRIARTPTARLRGRTRREAERLNLFTDHAAFSAWHAAYRSNPNDPALQQSPYYEMYRRAIYLMTTQTIVEPQVGNQPLFSSSRNPLKRTLGQLQGFAFAFSDGPVSYLWDETRSSRGLQLPRIAAILVPTAVMTALAVSLRESLNFDEIDDEDRRLKKMLDDEPTFMKAFEYFDKTGYLIPQYSRPLNTLFAAKYGGSGVVGGILGPFAGQTAKFVEATGKGLNGDWKHLEREFKRMVPFAAQSRPIRRELNLDDN